MKVRINFISPFVVGGIKLVSNYIESIDYIPGNVIRAALARYILNNCYYYDPDEVVTVDGVQKKNWVYFKDKPRCSDCKLKTLCQKLGDIKISFFYPKDTRVIPSTLMMCKANPQHGFVDRLIEQPKCPKCEGGRGRVEFVSGLFKDGKKYNVVKSFVTRTAINRYTGTAKDGSLYSLLAVSATLQDQNTGYEENVFEGQILGLMPQELSIIDELRIGKYTSVGLGRCNVTVIGEKVNTPDVSKVIQSLREFDAQYKRNNGINDDGCRYFAIKFISDVKLDFGFADVNEYMSTDQYKAVWLKALGINLDVQVEKVYAEVFNFRGYDTSKVGEDKREQPVHMVEKGSVIVFKTHLAFDKVIDYFDSLEGFGQDTNDGFGKFDYHFGGVC
ncbi:hypothetical protein KVG29_08475 [Caldicoprobacter algeriensis]|uniref:RAMP superfamily CRISPR-associated protein n=1 Tax=Caldicoprobacter algeriensis TaxID=699281 RepID=UPI0020794FB8|nr:RAMP superfamily CRISPR-associated protein [Caldicoprobacter algeriensis]MCM8901255.1 hypothetical protein [Caldicoprobacter algeriensis]